MESLENWKTELLFLNLQPLFAYYTEKINETWSACIMNNVSEEGVKTWVRQIQATIDIIEMNKIKDKIGWSSNV